MDLIDSLVQYVNEIKPFHTKIYGVDVEYRASDNLSVSFNEQVQFGLWLGVPFRDLTTFDWSINSLTLPSQINFTDFMHQHGCNIDLYQPWDDQIDGFDIAQFLDNGFTVSGDVTPFFNNVLQITISDTDQNDGIYDIISVSYDVNTQKTSILVTQNVIFEQPAGNIRLSKWDGIKWDSIFHVDPQCIIKTGLMHDFVAVTFSESLTFSIEKVTNLQDPDCDVITTRPWDPDCDGIAVYGYTSTSVILFGNILPILTALTTFEILGSDVNDGSYSVVSYVYNPDNDTTSITVSIGPNPNGVGGRARLSFWDGYQWDGDSAFSIQTPPGDLCAHTSFSEYFTLADAALFAGWDDDSAGGWDNLMWDDVNVYIHETLHCFSPPIVPPAPSDQTNDQFWKNDPVNTIPYTWNDIQGYWEHVSTDSVWEFALIPRIDGTPGNWVSGLRANVLRVTLSPGPDEGNFGILFGNIFLYDTFNNQVASSPIVFADYNDVITVDMVVDNTNNLDYSQLLVEMFLYTTGPRISLIEFDPL